MAKEHADLIRRLSKKWLETGDDAYLDHIDNVTKEASKLVVPDQRILERYLNATLDIHLHLFRVEIGMLRTSFEHKEWCAIAQRVFGKTLPSNSSGLCNVRMERFNVQVCSESVSQRQGAMLVYVNEMVKTQKGTELRDIASVVRLQPLDQCNGWRGHAVKSVSSELILEGVRAITDRKLVLGNPMVGRIGLDQLPDQVIQGRPKIVETVANEDTEHQRGRRNFSKELNPIRIDVLLSNEAAFFLVPLDLGSYHVQMLFGPDDFQSDSVERMVHDNASAL